MKTRFKSRQARLDELKAEKESTFEALQQNEGADIHETTLQLPAAQIQQILTRFRKQPLKDLLREDPKNYAAMVNSLAKLNKAALDIEMFNESVAEQREQREAELDQDKQSRNHRQMQRNAAPDVRTNDMQTRFKRKQARLRRKHADALKAEKESIFEALQQNEGSGIHETTLQLAASQIQQILTGFKPEKGLLENDPKNYTAITNCLAKLSKSALETEMFKEDLAEQRHQDQVELDKDKPRVITRETIELIEKELNLL